MMNGYSHSLHAISFWFDGLTIASLDVYQAISWILLAAMMVCLIAWRWEKRKATELERAISNQQAELRTAAIDKRRLAELMQAVVEGTTDAIFVKDLQGRYLLLNEATSRFVGKPAEEILGRDDRDLFPPAHAAFLMARDREVMEANRPSTAEELLTSAGVTRTYLATKAPYRNSQGEVIGLVGVSRDITERKQLESDASQAQKIEGVVRLAGGIAHDFNNLLTVINGYCELLLLSPADPNLPCVNWRESICEIRDAGERAARLTGQLLAFSRRGNVRPLAMNLNRVVEEIRPVLQRLVGDQIEVELQLKEDLPNIMADPDQIEHMLVNLIMHARDAMPAGGHLALGTDVQKYEVATTYLGRLVAPGTYVRLSISDGGSATSHDGQVRVFDPFACAGCHGLGLSLVHAVATECGGCVAYECLQEGGTLIHVLLPISRM